MEPFEIAVVAALLMAFAAASNRLASSPVTMPITFVAAGAALSATGVVEVKSELEAVGLLAEVTLSVILFSDSTRLSLPRLRRNLGFPIRLLAIGLPLTVLLGTVTNSVIFGGWPIAEALLLAAILAPTDAALGSAVVSDPEVPVRDRLALNVESGLNDGLVVPIVAIATSLTIGGERSLPSWVGFAAQQIGLGTLIGLVAGFGGVTLLRRSRAANWSDGRYEQIATFGLPILSFAIASSAGGNGFIAAFVGGLAFGSGGFATRRTHDEEADDLVGPEEAEGFAEFTEDAAELLGAVTFFVFGNLFVVDALSASGPTVILAALASLTFVRVVPVFVALTGSGCDTASKLFIGWFGPRGLASIVFAILLLDDLDEYPTQANRLIEVISLTVTMSVVLHGASAAFGARRYAAHVRRTGGTASHPDAGDELPRTRWSESRQA